LLLISPFIRAFAMFPAPINPMFISFGFIFLLPAYSPIAN
jgi:hypothetical protein